MKKILLALLLSLSATAFAETQTGKITGYIPYDAGGKQLFFVALEGNVTGGCNSTGRFAFNSDQLRFKGTQAALMAAFHNQTEVTVTYAPTCNTYANVWDLVYVCVGKIAC
jgi:hypothetical protein